MDLRSNRTGTPVAARASRLRAAGAFMKRRARQLDSLQRLLLYGVVVVWFLAFVLSQQRNYRDTWILEDIFLPFLLWTAAFLWFLWQESDNRFIALGAAITGVVLGLIPGLKYAQPYGTAVDSAIHYLMTQQIVTTGGVIPEHTYASIAGMHAWLASLAVTSGISPAEAMKIGLPLLGSIMPLLVYWLSRQAGLPSRLTKYTTATTPLAIFPYFYPNGTGFTLPVVMFIVGVLIARELAERRWWDRVGYTVLALVGLAQLVVWHSTTPILVPVILFGVSLAPLFFYLLVERSAPNANAKRLSVASGVLRGGVLAGIFFFSYRIVRADQIFATLVGEVNQLLALQEDAPAAVPERLFEIGLLDTLRVSLVIHGRDLLMVGLTALAFLLLWRYRRRWSAWISFYVYLTLAWVVFAALIVAALASGAGYARFLALPVAISPFFAGLLLWWVKKEGLPRIVRTPGAWRNAAWMGAVAVMIGLAILQFYTYQPFVPKAKALAPGAEDEYLVWFNGVNSGYQQRMMSFAQTRTNPDTKFAVDYLGGRQFLRYFGMDVARQRGPYLPLYRQQPFASQQVELFLLHWPGPAGGLSEKVENRSRAKLQELRDTPGWGLIYDNGESFILHIGDGGIGASR